MKKRKIISALLLGCMAFSLMACGGKDKANDEEAKITVQVEESWLPYYEQVKTRVLEQHPNATIEFVTTGSFDHLDVIDSTSADNKDVADVFALPADRLYGLAQNNILAPIDGSNMAKEVGGFKDYEGGLGGNFKVGDEYLAFPYNIETLVVYVNKANAEKAGIDLTKNIEFNDLAYGKLLVPVHDAWYGVGFTNSADYELLSNEDGLKSDGIKSWSELDEKQKGLFTSLYNYWKTQYDNKTNLWDKDAWGGFVDAEFSKDGGAAFRIDGPWATTSLSELVGEDNIAVIPLSQITVNGEALSHWKGGWGLGVNARIEGNEAQLTLAQDFIKEVVNPDYAKDLFNATGKILDNVEPSAYDGIGGMNEAVIKATYESYDVAVNRPLFTEYGKVWDSWQNALLSWSAQKPATAEEAYKQVEASFESMMGTFK